MIKNRKFAKTEAGAEALKASIFIVVNKIKQGIVESFVHLHIKK